MQKDKNHIGTALAFCKDVATEIGARYSHGNITEMNMRSMLVYPYMHTNVGQVSLGSPMATVQVNIMIADRVNTITTENQGLNQETLYSEIGYTENNNYAMVLQQLYVDFAIAVKKYEELYYNALEIQRPIQFTAFEETYDDVIAGFTITLNIDVANPIVTDGYC
jgi:hypothetical protein